MGKSKVTLWGSGTPRREFLHVDDLANAACFLMESYDAAGLLNVGVSKDVTITELAQLIARTVGYTGNIDFDRLRPEGTPCKLLDSSHTRTLGWRPQVSLERGIASTYEWYVEHLVKVGKNLSCPTYA